MAERTAEEEKTYYVEKMGETLGTQFHLLLEEVTLLHLKWSEGVELFGSGPTRMELLNDAAPTFFLIIENILWDDALLHLSRLTDPPKSIGKNGKPNLTIKNLPELINDPGAKAALGELVKIAEGKVKICRDWRNSHIAHCDLRLVLSGGAGPLEPSSKHVNEALESVVAVLNAVSVHFTETEQRFKTAIHGSEQLLVVLDAGVRKLRESQE
jgi:hypothetical protein